MLLWSKGHCISLQGLFFWTKIDRSPSSHMRYIQPHGFTIVRTQTLKIGQDHFHSHAKISPEILIFCSFYVDGPKVYWRFKWLKLYWMQYTQEVGHRAHFR
jgi:hypothetical protein